MADSSSWHRRWGDTSHPASTWHSMAEARGSTTGRSPEAKLLLWSGTPLSATGCPPPPSRRLGRAVSHSVRDLSARNSAILLHRRDLENRNRPWVTIEVAKYLLQQRRRRSSGHAHYSYSSSRVEGQRFRLSPFHTRLPFSRSSSTIKSISLGTARNEPISARGYGIAENPTLPSRQRQDLDDLLRTRASGILAFGEHRILRTNPRQLVR